LSKDDRSFFILFINNQLNMRQLRGIGKNFGILSQLLLLFGIACVFFYLAVAILMLLGKTNASDINSIRWLQLLQSVGIFILPPFIFSYFCSEQPLDYLSLNKTTNSLAVRYVVLIMIVCIPFIDMFTYFNQQMQLPDAFSSIENWMKSMEEEAARVTEQLLDVKGIDGLLLNLLLIALIPAFGEELFFRGTLQKIFNHWKKPQLAIWITAILFSAFHLQFYGFLPRLLLGVFFGYLLWWSGSLWLPVIAHFTNNALAIIFSYINQRGIQILDPNAVGQHGNIWLGIGSAVLSGYLILRLQKNILSHTKS